MYQNIHFYFQKKKYTKKAKEIKKEKRISGKSNGNDDIVCGFALCTFNLLDREFLLVVHLNFPIFAGKCLCWSLFLIKNFKPTQMFSCKYCRIFKSTCFEEQLQTAASIRCYLDSIILKQSTFCTTSSFKIFV